MTAGSSDMKQDSYKQRALVICGFPGVGKTFCAKSMNERPPGFEQYSFEDIDSTPFAWLVGDDNSRLRNPDFPHNYVDFITQRARTESILFISTHESTVQALVAAGVRFVLLYPEVGLREEYVARYRRRGTAQETIEVISDHWDEWLRGNKENDCDCHVVLKAGQYLTDVIPEILLWQKQTRGSS